METVSRDGGPEFVSAARIAMGEPGLIPVHRLDRDTSGALILARNRAAEAKLVQLFRRRLVEKTYLAICLGIPRNRTGNINRNLSEWEGGRRPVRVLKKGGLEASTGYEVLKASLPSLGDFNLSLIAFRPHQGRTHQIRVHAAAIGYPILGDDQYGDRPANKRAKALLDLRRQALHSWKLRFPWNDRQVEAVCPLSEDLAHAVRIAFNE